ncbi:hydroxymethylglutaryl-CoA synthase [Halogranum gelatinilyticum]|uniref:Hydroxymethylglutaryl-CoA synthase n=1 Tax=Halogranum gelatinilyticum TaxID=660521 RepID=A0A1G9WH53_9EURY|nr:zinc ribbon domain-containing protein [Halogranum gelatinilyticum]SDM83385.1 hydroxymethylglutaryl-CoA synthase [Halogranum gelatinilyticum]
MTDGRGSAVGIAGIGVYLPRARIDAETVREAWGQFSAAGVQSKAVAGADEDSLTMAADAAERALDAAGVDATALEQLVLATTTPPLAEEDPTARLGEFLGVDAATPRRFFTGSTRAGTQALGTAEPGETPALVVAADCPRGEPNSPEDHAAGAGAAAFVLSEAGAAKFVDHAEYAVDYPGTRFRRQGSERVEGLGVSAYDRQAFVECVAGAVSGLDSDPNPSAVALQAPDGKLPYRVTGALGVDAEAISSVTPIHEFGDLGAASPLVALATALDAGHERVLTVGYGGGAGADALVVACEADGPDDFPPVETSDTEGVQVSYAEYLRLRGELTGEPPAGGGAAVSVPSWRRTHEARYRLVAGKCAECGALTFPPEGACRACHALDEFERVELPREGEIETVTTVSPGGAPPEFAQFGARGGDFAVALVAFEHAGETVSMPLQVVDTDPEAVSAGDAVEATRRRIYTQEGVTRYGTKVRPLD